MVLRRHYQERLVQRERRFPDGNLFLLHGFEECRLNLCGRAVDLIRKNNVREYRTLFDLKFSLALIVDHRTHQVGRKEVWRKLSAAKLKMKDAGKHTHR